MTYHEITMNVALRPEIAKFVKEQVDAGRYQTPDDVVTAGVARLMQDDFEFDPGELHALAEQGKRDIFAGKTITMDALREQFRERLTEVSTGQ